MNWSDVAETVGEAAPVVGSALYGRAGGAVGGMVAKALGVEGTPEAVNQAMQDDPKAAAKIQQVEADLEQARITARTERLSQVNKTMRAEVDSDSTLKGGWRGFTGWMFGLSLGGVMASIVFEMFAGTTDRIELLRQAVMMFGVFAAVLGIDINRVGKERLAAKGIDSRSFTFMDALKTRVAGK
ncbi:3TM-type holin [Halomonas sp. I1]|uniref:3TM-type holin n=1 Tax=Halomonas sp. I1 TaxID=393536 RepID=UPI0028DFF3D7|nr:3TM-type holin [Halomonas sp. I1]MDT8895649.1 3TM-type holin [Halomonas sp. I1]